MFMLIRSQLRTGWLVGSVRLDEAGFPVTGDALGADARSAEPRLPLGCGPLPA